MPKKILTETDLGVGISQFPPPRRRARRPYKLVFVQGLNPWSAESERACREGRAPCQCCGRWRDDPPVHPHSRYCLGCDSAGLDGLVSYPGDPVGFHTDHRWPTVGGGAGGLKGGRGVVVRGAPARAKTRQNP